MAARTTGVGLANMDHVCWVALWVAAVAACDENATYYKYDTEWYPNCTVDGGWEAVQCTANQLFCWCVDEPRGAADAEPPVVVGSAKKMTAADYPEMMCTRAPQDKDWTNYDLPDNGASMVFTLILVVAMLVVCVGLTAYSVLHWSRVHVMHANEVLVHVEEDDESFETMHQLHQQHQLLFNDSLPGSASGYDSGHARDDTPRYFNVPPPPTPPIPKSCRGGHPFSSFGSKEASPLSAPANDAGALPPLPAPTIPVDHPVSCRGSQRAASNPPTNTILNFAAAAGGGGGSRAHTPIQHLHAPIQPLVPPPAAASSGIRPHGAAVDAEWVPAINRDLNI
eukprot:gene13056-20137_t